MRTSIESTVQLPAEEAGSDAPSILFYVAAVGASQDPPAGSHVEPVESADSFAKPAAVQSVSSIRKRRSTFRAGWGAALSAWAISKHFLPRIARPIRPVPAKLWVAMILLTCISGVGLVIGTLKSRETSRSATEIEIVDDFKDLQPSSFPAAPAGPELQPLAAPAAPLSAAVEVASAPVEPGMVQPSSAARPSGAWLVGTIIEDESGIPETKLTYDSSRSRPQ